MLKYDLPAEESMLGTQPPSHLPLSGHINGAGKGKGIKEKEENCCGNSLRVLKTRPSPSYSTARQNPTICMNSLDIVVTSLPTIQSLYTLGFRMS